MQSMRNELNRAGCQDRSTGQDLHKATNQQAEKARPYISIFLRLLFKFFTWYAYVYTFEWIATPDADRLFSDVTVIKISDKKPNKPHSLLLVFLNWESLSSFLDIYKVKFKKEIQKLWLVHLYACFDSYQCWENGINLLSNDSWICFPAAVPGTQKTGSSSNVFPGDTSITTRRTRC